MPVACLYVEKKPLFAVEAAAVAADLRATAGLAGLRGVRLLCRYLVEGLTPVQLAACRGTVFSEPQVDEVYDSLPSFAPGARFFLTELLPGQFDQRADSCAQCIMLLLGVERPSVRCAKVWVLEGDLSEAEYARAKGYLINPVESREALPELPDTLEADFPEPPDVAVITGFSLMDNAALLALRGRLGLAMDDADIRLCRDTFAELRRDPTLTELRLLDTYWSDHCRHTTFLTQITELTAAPEFAARSYRRYLSLRERLGRADKPVTLMDMATIAKRALKADGLLGALDESDEINACTVRVTIDVNGQPQDWLLLFKNETHNHPTEIEPFGGAATCLGGAIRDPLSGRGYVYQALRLTGAANPLTTLAQTRAGKLPQKKLCQTAAAGYSAYGNQIGLATGLVRELYHPGYEAKRMELGAVVAAAPAANVRREIPAPGDIVLLLGGRTGRDGCGGATGSSKSHTAGSLESCGAEVQKGNPPEERKLQRLFRNPEAARLIGRCNDFGAGGVSVAIGELASGLRIDLDAIPRKYHGLNGTELAISESQERMAVVVSQKDTARFIELAGGENLEATVVARVTAEPRLVMTWRGKPIVDLPRELLDSNGAPRRAAVAIATPDKTPQPLPPVTRESLFERMPSLNFCSQRGLIERFDSTVGAGSVLLPLGGKYQITPAHTMAALLPVEDGETDACSLMSYGCWPEASEISPFHGAVAAVVESVARIIAAGGSRKKCWLTFQEFYQKPGNDPAVWGKPAAALLGALEAQLALGVAAIGGKDSMSGSFSDSDGELHVPPTFVSIAVGLTKAGNVVSGEFAKAGSAVYLFAPELGDTPDELPHTFESTRTVFDTVERLIAGGKIAAARAVGNGGTAEAVCLMCFGNRTGFVADKPLSWQPHPGAFVVEAAQPLPELENCLLGHTAGGYLLLPHGADGERIELAELEAAWSATLEPVYPTKAGNAREPAPGIFTFAGGMRGRAAPRLHTGAGAPRVLIPVFPGTNCEYDTAAAARRAGLVPELFIVRNLTAANIAAGAGAFAARVGESCIIAIPGGFSGGDEPDGSAKLITAFFRNARVREAVEDLLLRRDGLMLGICNGFQALVKLGLLPYGAYREPLPSAPTLTYNRIGRHQSRIVRTRVCSGLSPWLAEADMGDIYGVPVSNGEGRFVAGPETIAAMASAGQIATQYVDFAGAPTMDIDFNPSGAAAAIEGITSPDGRILGKMGHVERHGPLLYRNCPPARPALDIFAGAARYFGL